jgi:type I restriction enzyme, S subunit
MAGEWASKSLGEICEFRGGQGFPHKHQGAVVGEYPFIKVSDMELPGNRHRITRANHWIDEATRKELRAKPHPATSTVFAKIGVALTYNRRRLLSRPTIVDNNMMAAVPIESEVDPLFLYYLLKVTDFNEVVSGTALPFINGSDLAKMQVEIPPLTTQRAIAHVLGTLDDLIELNRETNEILEEMARALFKSWFVDFDPVRAKLEGRAPAGMDAATAALFPDHFQDSELGQIPKGWEVKPLGDLADMDKGLSYKGSGLAEEGGMPMVNLGCFSGRGIFNTDKIKRYTGEYRERHIVHAGDLVIANTDMTQNRVIIGSPSIVPRLGRESKFIFTHHVFAVRFKPGADVFRRYVYFTLLKPEFREIAEGFSTGTTVLALPRDGLTKYMLCLPPVTLIEEFERQAEPLLAIIHANNEESRELASLRDILLPKLLSGEVEAPKNTPDHDA